MASSEQVARLGAARRRIVELVQGQLASFFAALPLDNPARATDALLEYLPLLVDQYGPMAEQVALEWYSDVRGNGYQPIPAPNRIPRGAIEAQVKYQAGHLFTGAATATLDGLSSSLAKYVSQPARDSIAYNAEREGIRYARVPRGAKTCAFCLMLASRTDEWLYLSRESANFDLKNGEKFHGGKCDCEVVPVAGEDDFPDPHLRRERFEMYRTATDAVGSRSDTSAILAYMRREFPDQITDSVIDPLHVH